MIPTTRKGRDNPAIHHDQPPEVLGLAAFGRAAPDQGVIGNPGDVRPFDPTAGPQQRRDPQARLVHGHRRVQHGRQQQRRDQREQKDRHHRQQGQSIDQAQRQQADHGDQDARQAQPHQDRGQAAPPAVQGRMLGDQGAALRAAGGWLAHTSRPLKCGLHYTAICAILPGLRTSHHRGLCMSDETFELTLLEMVHGGQALARHAGPHPVRALRRARRARPHPDHRGQGPLRLCRSRRGVGAVAAPCRPALPALRPRPVRRLPLPADRLCCAAGL